MRYVVPMMVDSPSVILAVNVGGAVDLSVFEECGSHITRFSPSVPHRLDHEVSLQGDWKARCGSGYERLSGRCAKTWASRSSPAFCRENMSICRRILPSPTLCGASRDGHHIDADGVPATAKFPSRL